MQSFSDYRQCFLALYTAVKNFHETTAHPHRGHGLDHDAAVATMGTILAPNETTARLAFCAGLLHSIDRLVDEKEIDTTLNACLRLISDQFTPSGIEEIKEAVLRHVEFKDRNLGSRKLTQKLLMDADKLVNMDPLLIVRCGQMRAELPAVELQFVGADHGSRYANPNSTYHQPMSVLDDVRGSIEWTEPGWFHFPQAQEIAEERARFLKEYIRRAESAIEELGLAGIEL